MCRYSFVEVIKNFPNQSHRLSTSSNIICISDSENEIIKILDLKPSQMTKERNKTIFFKLKYNLNTLSTQCREFYCPRILLSDGPARVWKTTTFRTISATEIYDTSCPLPTYVSACFQRLHMPLRVVGNVFSVPILKHRCFYTTTVRCSLSRMSKIFWLIVHLRNDSKFLTFQKVLCFTNPSNGML